MARSGQMDWLNETKLTQLVSLGRSCRNNHLAYHNESTYSGRFLQRPQHVNAAPQTNAKIRESV
jgi:hypothetical protein